MSEVDAECILKDTDSGGKNELLFSKFNINYNSIEPIFRKGSVLYRGKVKSTEKSKNTGEDVIRLRPSIITDHCDLIGESFWKANPNLLN